MTIIICKGTYGESKKLGFGATVVVEREFLFKAMQGEVWGNCSITRNGKLYPDTMAFIFHSVSILNAFAQILYTEKNSNHDSWIDQ